MGWLKDQIKHHLGEGIREFLVGIAANKASASQTIHPSNKKTKAEDFIAGKLLKKRMLLEKHVTASRAERKRAISFVKDISSDSPGNHVTRSRYEDFLAECLGDRQEIGKSEEEIQDFFIWLSKLKEDDMDTLVLLCTEVDASGKTCAIPGTTLLIEKMRKPQHK